VQGRDIACQERVGDEQLTGQGKRSGPFDSVRVGALPLARLRPKHAVTRTRHLCLLFLANCPFA
jgi:hypothetical protein